MTEHPERDELLAVLDHTDDAMVLVGRDDRVRFGNQSAADWLGDDGLTGRPLAALLPEPEGDLALAWRRAAETGEPQRAEAYSPDRGAWLDLEARPLADDVLLRVRDTTEHCREQLAGIVVAETADAAAMGVGTVRALTAAAATLRRLTGYELATVWLRDLVGTVRLISCDPAATNGFAEVATALQQAGFAADRPAHRSLEEGTPQLTPHLPDDLGPALADPVAAAGLRVGIHLPLHWADGSAAVIGLLTRAPPGRDDWHAVLTRAHTRLAARAVRVRDHQELSQLFDLARNGLCISGADHRFHRVNPQLATMLGRDVDELTGRHFLDLVHPDDRRTLSDAVARLLAGGEPEPFEHRVLLPSGEERILSWTSKPSPSEGLVYSAARDVTEERRRERFETDQRRLLESIVLGEPLEQSLRQVAAAAAARLAGNVKGAVWLADHDGDALQPAEGQSTGTPTSKIAAIAAHEALTAGRPAVIDEPGAGAATTCWAAPVHGQDREPIGAVVLEIDRATAPSAAELEILEDAARLASLAVGHHWTQVSLRRSEERFRLLAGAVTDALWDWDLIDDVLWFNDGFAVRFGYHRSEIASALDLWKRNIHEQDRARVLESVDEAVISGRDAWEAEYRFHDGDGSEVIVFDRGTIMRDESGRALRMVGGMWDLTAHREREAARERSQRLASLGTLAGGLAHDVGNMLAPILLSAEVLAGRDLDETSGRFVERIERSARRGNAMIEQVMTFARGTTGERQPVDVARLLAGLAEDAIGLVDERVAVVVEDVDELPPVLGDASQLHQVLLNLVLNARDAMPGGGTLTVAAHRSLARDGREQVRFCVDDTGIGMTDEVRERVFEPFFTTKSADKGTGLGMAVAMAIVEGHEGTLEVASQPDHGTRVSIFLPAGQSATS